MVSFPETLVFRERRMMKIMPMIIRSRTVPTIRRMGVLLPFSAGAWVSVGVFSETVNTLAV